MRPFAFVVVSAVCVGWSFAQNGTLTCTRTAVVQNLKVQEGTEKGTILLNITDADDATLVRFPRPSPPPFIGLANGSLYFNATLDVDSNEDWCHLLWDVYVRCDGEQLPNRYSIEINFTNDFPPEFTRNFSATIDELSTSGTLVNTFTVSDIRDRDCDSRVNIGSSTIFSIEDGNTGGAFRIDRAGRTFVNKTLDYEHGDTRFLLNISVSDRSAPHLKSFTTMDITVNDLDDNDPVFNDTSYALHVAEHNQSSVNVWRQTDPPLSVFDPDVNAPADPLVISLYDPVDASVLEVNSTSREVRLMKTFDHNQLAAVPVVLKVQQTNSPLRSSTVTLTIVIEDVNDNRPAFQPSQYDVTIAEHSSVGSSVAFISATDSDSGDNAVFNYTVVSGGEMFTVATRLLGERRYGFLSILNSSLLDRENIAGTVTVTIGTQELTPPVGPGGGCAGVHCQATVTVHLQDINDNSPVFQRNSYDVLVDHISAHEVIATVNATDADKGQNAAVKYTLQSYGFKGCSDVVIDSTSGDVSFNGNATLVEDCSVVITACDSPLDVTQQRCTSVTMRISLHLANETVILDTSVASSFLIADRAVVQRELSNILGVIVTVINIVSDSTGKRSRIFISAKNATSPDPLPRDKLQLLVNSKSKEIAEFFERFQQTSSSENETNKAGIFSVELITLIAVAGALLVALIVAFVFIYRSHKRNQRQQRLIQGLSGVTHIYDNTGGDVSKVENGTASLINNIALADDDDNGTNAIGVVNPVFEEDEDTLGNGDSPRSEDAAVDGSEETTAVGSSPDRMIHHHHDADSGVPSDRENGTESDSEAVTPVMSRSSGVVEGSSYLDAVLNEVSLSHSSEGVSSVDTSASELGCGVNVVQDPSYHPVDVHVDNAETTVGFEDRKNGTEEEEQERIVMFTDEGGDRGGVISPATHQPRHDTGSGLTLPVTGNQEDDADDEEVVGIMSRLGQMVRSSTPPLRHHSHGNVEDVDHTEANGMPEEPEPDYAKKVRFSVQITEHETQHAEEKEESSGAGDGADGGGVIDGQGHDGEQKGGDSTEQKPPEPEDAVPENTDNAGSAHSESTEVETYSPVNFNPDEEITAF